MTHVYLTQGEHPYVPGCPLSVHATRKGAQAQALSLLNVVRDDYGPCKRWSGVALQRTKVRLENDCNVDQPDWDIWITKLELGD
ncbi:hypothetical protein UFOVP134_34 [uncultured Caudovirales phage]|uniref:Uncharacterized protein n=1 Tax=uncultured Caudovirales phage TaxID=2100421 RepID=A0A6J5LGA3_9CAUD|nr:hypothetical protein UFOVP134_34 [uncultured Caudovirales phage]